MPAQCFGLLPETVYSFNPETRYPVQDRGNTPQVDIRGQPLPEHERHDALQSIREKFLVLAKNQALTPQTLSSAMVVSSCNLVFRFLPFHTIFQTKIRNRSDISEKIFTLTVS